MTDTGAAPDVDVIVRELQTRVAERFESGEYPPELERELAAHFEELARSRRLPDRFAELMRRVDDASAFSPHRIQLVSSIPGGRRLHALIAAAVRRQVSGILAQDRLFAVAVRDVLTEIIASLPERSAPDAWWEVSDAYLDELYGARAAAVDALAGPAKALVESEPVLVLETGRGELGAAVRRHGVEPVLGDVDPLAELSARADGTIGGLGVRRVLERVPPPALERFAELSARKVRAGGRVLVELRGRLARPDPALPHIVDPGYLAFLLDRGGFAEVRTSRGPDSERVTARR